MSNKVFIATSLDGFIADKNGGIEWLHSIPNPDGNDMGYQSLMNEVDALVMGRVTFETVHGFGIDWPYEKPVFVLSNSLKSVPETLREKVFIVNGDLKAVISQINAKGFQDLYIDGGSTIQNFLKEDLIDEMVITTIPILLGGGVPLFGTLPKPLNFQCIESNIYLERIVQSKFVRVRD